MKGHALLRHDGKQPVSLSKKRNIQHSTVLEDTTHLPIKKKLKKSTGWTIVYKQLLKDLIGHYQSNYSERQTRHKINV